MADLPESPTAGSTTGHATDSGLVNKFVNSIARVSTTAPQATIDAVPTRTDFGDIMALRRLWLTAGFVITTPLLLARGMELLEGSSPGQLLSNSTTDSDIIRINAGSTDSKIGGGVARASIKGTGTGSRGVYANLREHLALVELNLINHPGTGVFFESLNHTALRGVAFAYLRQVLIQPSAAVPCFHDDGGLFNTVQSSRFREGEIGIDQIDNDGSDVRGNYIESQNRGTVQTGIRNRATDNYFTRRGARYVSNYFENNPGAAIDVDRHTFVIVENCSNPGGTNETTKTWKDKILLDGGGIVRAIRGSNGTYLSSKHGRIRAEGNDGVVGRVDEVNFVGLMPPLDSTGHNDATKSCFDSDPTWTAAGSSAPTLSYDTGTRLLGRGSKKAIFQPGGSGGAYARAWIDNAKLALSVGDDFYTAVAFKCSAAGEAIRIRHLGPHDGTVLQAITDTVWQIAILSTCNVADAGNYTPVIELGASVGSALSIWVGAVAASTSSALAFLNTEGTTTLEAGQIEVQGVVMGQMGIYTWPTTPEGALTAAVGSVCLAGDGNLYRKGSGSGNTGWVAV